MGTFSDCIGDNRDRIEEFRTVSFTVDAPEGELQLLRTVDRFPYVPSDPRRAAGELLRGLQHSGARPDQTAAGDADTKRS